ncbi:MAG: asparagine synthase (glutamine-hydrolyzing) [Thermodesulfobacteriota bacterium]
MCGFAGFFRDGFRNGDEMAAAVSRMAQAIAHRGPDDSGVWVDAEAGIALGHRRLSILDLSCQGHQPMLSGSGRYVVAYNGEIYNHRALRRELESEGAAPPWRGRSDTEAMLAAFEHWGVAGALERFNGMFAFALWDRRERTLHLARDRMGEKPLYYGRAGDTLLFGSELKALRAHPAWRGEIDRGALALYMRHNVVPAPYSIYREIRKLLPAHLLSIPLPDSGRDLPPSREYWSARKVMEAGAGQPFAGPPEEAVEALDALLRDAVALRMEADVPLGAFLSGGCDSSTVAALMQAQSARPVKTFTIGFRESEYDEAKQAGAVAQELGTEHTEHCVTPDEAMAVIPELPALYDEPFADSSQIPTFLVSRTARRRVTVALSGDGGDELFGGYNRHSWVRDIWRHAGWLPKPAKAAIARGLTALSPGGWDKVFSAMDPLLPGRLRVRLPGDKVHKFAGTVTSSSPEEIYRRLVSHWEPESVVLDSREPPTVLTDRSKWPDVGDITRRMMFLDLATYLPDDILAKVDRASMGVSLEARVPLLDHRVVEFAWRLPLEMRIRDGEGKWILRRLLRRYLPARLVEAPKMGFGIPIDAWLRGPLKEWVEELLDEGRLKREGFFRPEPVRSMWREHLSGRRNWSYHLWDVLMFQAWLGAA